MNDAVIAEPGSRWVGPGGVEVEVVRESVRVRRADGEVVAMSLAMLLGQFQRVES